VWLVQDKKQGLAVVTTHDAGNPTTDNQQPLLCCDLWEHAFYVDYRNDKAKYIKSWWSVCNWEFVNAQLDVDHEPQAKRHQKE